MRRNRIEKGRRAEIKQNFRKIMNCLCSGEQLRPADEMVPSTESHATKDCTTSGNSTRGAEILKKPDAGNIEEAESSLRESGCLNYEVCCFIPHLLMFPQPLTYQFSSTFFLFFSICWCLYWYI